MTNTRIMIAGGGIGGLSLALTLHQIGVPCVVFEAASELRPLGVGINIQPNAIRELFDMNISAEALDKVGVPAKEWALVGQNGHEIYSEPRGILAGYNWPQYALHRGEFQLLLARIFCQRAGTDALQLGQRVTGYENNADGTVTALIKQSDGSTKRESGTLLIGADGIHSNVRAQMHPDQPPIHWGGAVMWRGTTRAKPIRTGASFVGLGTHKHRMVIYPISPPDPETGLAVINWIAEVTYDDPEKRDNIGWFRQVEISNFAHHFQDWKFDIYKTLWEPQLMLSIP
ncbi:MAG: FAD-dependent monooxygenase [Rhodobacteraceae bacterium]|nr:FAD-dependent monooxygenase [Paracoccaceae bacterium]